MSEERVMVLTGASSGLGAEVAAHFADKGFGIAMNYIVEEDSRATYERIASEVGEERIMRYRADVADREQVRSMFDAGLFEWAQCINEERSSRYGSR